MAAPGFPQPMYAPLADLGREWLLPGLDQMAIRLHRPVRDELALRRVVPGRAQSRTGRKLLLERLSDRSARQLLPPLLGHPRPAARAAATSARFTSGRRRWGERQLSPPTRWCCWCGGADPPLPERHRLRRPAVSTPRRRAPGTAETHPIFFGLIEPDIALFGFDVDPAVARGNPGGSSCSRSTRPSRGFGLGRRARPFGAQPATWQALGWDHLAASATDLARAAATST